MENWPVLMAKGRSRAKLPIPQSATWRMTNLGPIDIVKNMLSKGE
jgi:hypothetical protein